jgi:hypothetical protein
MALETQDGFAGLAFSAIFPLRFGYIEAIVLGNALPARLPAARSQMRM